ncbi:NAD(P)H-hydrate dehydratase [Aquihabitans sp. McL0605]|uniref:NAD(P)H-hydrate dehydratase n=1 Tax=Aquihabitans sp. McL0605 TaxID=3415671 RepID=UPI003CF1EC01
MLAIVTPQEMGAIDAAAPEPVDVLIDRAGAAVARAALDLLGGAYGRRVVVLAGKGNNGADGRAAAARLEARGVRCQVLDAADLPASIGPVDLVIDAAYGTGFRGTFAAPDLVAGTPVLAVDIPSGVAGLTGEASGRPLRADRTITFAALKPGLLLADGPGLAGEVEVADIGLDVSGARTHLVEPWDVGAWLPERPRSTHKWKAAVWLVAGSPGMTGAAHLAAAAAQRSGAGYVRLSVPGGGHHVDAPVEVVVVPLEAAWWDAELIDGEERFGSLAVGPGLGTGVATAAAVRATVAGTSTPVVVDGDGLRALGDGAASAVGRRTTERPDVVLTPHDGEFEALAGHPPVADRFAAARDLAATTGAVVLLKGPTTVVAHPDGRVLASNAGDARLATAGTGDVLTGLVAGLLAQGMAPLEAAASAALLHGAAGALAWRRGLVAGDLVDHLPAAFDHVAGG